MSRLAVGAIAAVGGVVLLAVVAVAGGTGAGGAAGGGFGVSVRPGSVPAPYAALVLAAGRTCDAAPPSLLAAQLEAESAWDPAARSQAGARGIAQFMPGTWSRWGRDASGDGRADPDDPRDAIAAQAGYDCALAADMTVALRAGRVRGTVTDLMLAAYNAGPGAVLAAGGVPAIEETRRYVARITSRAASFSELTGQALAAGGGFGDRLLRIAAAQTGVPYAWGGGSLLGPSEGFSSGAGTVGFDCSGLVRFAAYQASGGTMTLPRVADDQTRVGTPVPLDALRPGDVISFTRPGESLAHHIGVYAGDGRLLNAPQSGGRVRIDSLDTDYWRNQLWRAVRYQP